jgi:hypothetical protein
VDSEDALRTFKNAVFNAGVSPGRGYVQFFADAMRWPVDAFASRTVSDDNLFEHHVAWLKGNAIGSASYVANGEPTLTASVHPLASIVRIELEAGNIRDDGLTQTLTVKGILAAGTEHGDDLRGRPAEMPPALLRGPQAFDTEQTA